MGRPTLDRTKVCPRCGQEFRPKDWRTVHCGYRCAALAQGDVQRGGPMPMKTCEHCGRQFRKNAEYSYAVWKTIRFCSIRCRSLAWSHRREHVCVTCGISFRGKNGRKQQPYCSRTCYWLSLRTERYPVRNRRRGQEFSFRARRSLIERAGGSCGHCGAAEHLEFDHVIPCHAGGTNDESNGQVLCRDCHRNKTKRELTALFTR